MPTKQTSQTKARDKAACPPRRARPLSNDKEFLVDREFAWWAALALILPLTFSMEAMSPTGPLRTVMLAIFLGLFIVYFLLIRAGSERTSKLGKLTKALAVAGGAIFAIAAISSAFAVNKQEAVYATMRDGLLIVLVTLFARTVRREEAHLGRLFRAIPIVLSIQCLVAILQFYEVAFTDLPPRSEAPYGLMANRNVLACTVALMLPFCGYVVFKGGRRWRIGAGLAIWLGVYTLVIAQTRAAWLAVLAAVLVASFTVFVSRQRFGPSFQRGWWMAMAWLVAGTILAVGLSLALDRNGQLAGSLKARSLTLAAPQSGVERDHSIQGRLQLWRECLAMMRDRPLVGAGPGNWRIVSSKYGTAQSRSADGITQRDRAHNVFLQKGSEIGVAGFVIYLAIWVTLALILGRVLRTADTSDRRMLALMAAAGSAIFAVDAFFSFPDEFPVELVWFAWSIGIGVGLYEILRQPRPGPIVTSRFAPRPYLIGGGLAFLAVAAVVAYAHENYQRHVQRIFAFNKSGQHQRTLMEVAAARTPLVSLDPLGDPIELYSCHANVALGNYQQAEADIERALHYSPWSPRLWSEKGTVYSKLNQPDRAIECYDRALRLAPKFDVAKKNLGCAYYSKGDYRRSTEFLDGCKQNDPVVMQVQALAHRQLGELTQATATLQDAVRAFPDQVPLWELLAEIQMHDLQRPADAAAACQRILTLRPNHPKRDEYLRVIALAGQTPPVQRPPSSPVPR